jgi:hypothetical protein
MQGYSKGVKDSVILPSERREVYGRMEERFKLRMTLFVR